MRVFEHNLKNVHVLMNESCDYITVFLENDVLYGFLDVYFGMAFS